LFNHGPVSVAFEVIASISDYITGVYTDKACGTTPADVNHAVLAVGWGNDPVSGLDYWLIKNSWGSAWGDGGYFKIERNVNMCAIA